MSSGAANADGSKPGAAPVDEEGILAHPKAEALRLAGSADAGGPRGVAHAKDDALPLAGSAARGPSGSSSAGIQIAAPRAAAEPATEPAPAPQALREPVAFLGLGALGTPMAANLLAADVPLTVHNRNRQREKSLAALGARRAATPLEAATGSTVLCLCLSDDAAVRAVLLEGPDAAIGGLAPGSLVIDFSTIAPATSEELAARLRERGVAYLDAPVTGGTEGARAGTLSLLVGGEGRDVERARPLLEVVGGRISHFGPVGTGQQVKAVNQVLVAGSYAAVAEALALGQRLALPMEQVCEALMEGAAGSWALRHRSANMLGGTFPLGFRLALHHKDLQIALGAATAAGLELPVSAQVAAIEAELMAAGHGDEDVSALARWFAPQPEPVPSAMPSTQNSVMPSAEAAAWDQRYRDGRDGWELGAPTPPLEAFLRHDPRRPLPPGPVLVPGCGRGHEAALLADLGFEAVGLDISREALNEAQRLHGSGQPGLRWLQADLLDAASLRSAGLADGSLQGVVEHTCFCAIDPSRRGDYLAAVTRLLAPGGWLLGLFWCHGRPGGPPFGSDADELGGQLRGAGLVPLLWEPAQGSVAERPDEWLGLWQLAAGRD
jgi:3-hydroxyisobutyrate dehydrogenase-like beta-hydroxyacid dehydrogenase/SAM-dependent methyltransferase